MRRNKQKKEMVEKKRVETTMRMQPKDLFFE